MSARLAIALAAVGACAALAAEPPAAATARPRPPGTIPLDEAPPSPQLDEDPNELKPVVTTRVEGENTIQEYRIHGRLYMQRVVPKHGRPYVLIDRKGDGTFTRQDNTLDNGVRVPQWVIKEF